jgi:hypothetical protein
MNAIRIARNPFPIATRPSKPSGDVRRTVPTHNAGKAAARLQANAAVSPADGDAAPDTGEKWPLVAYSAKQVKHPRLSSSTSSPHGHDPESDMVVSTFGLESNPER